MSGRIDLTNVWQTMADKSKITERGKKWRMTWMNENPSASLHMLDDDDVDRFVQTHFSDSMYREYKNWPLGVMRADFWRYAVLYIHGGIYGDADTQCLRSIKDWFPPRSKYVEGEARNDNFNPGEVGGTLRGKPYGELTWDDCQIVISLENHISFCQWAIASIPGHPILRKVIELVYQKSREGINLSNPHFVHAHTGPGIWTRAIKDTILENAQVDDKKMGNSYDVIQRVWTDPAFNKAAGKLGVCLMAHSFFHGKFAENTRNMFGSQEKGEKSWIHEREELRKEAGFDSSHGA